MMAKYSGMSLLIVIVGFVYIFEMISDIIQIGSIKLRHGKKVFKMAPYHHHLEKSGWSERQIVLFSVGVTVVLGFVSYMFA
jgi:phospho-N-acetylmuramoyl-pentapeptide-transferase